MIPYDFFGMKIYMFKIPPPTPSKGGQNNATKKTPSKLEGFFD
jgi:hypothetical protein